MAKVVVSGQLMDVTVHGWFNGQESVNLWQYYVTPGSIVGAPTDLDIAVTLDTGLQAAYKAAMHNLATYRGVKVQLIPTTLSTYPVPQYVIANTGVGTGGASPTATAVCGLITKLTAFRGRKYRGRCYLPFPSTTAYDPTTGEPKAAYLTALANIGNLTCANWLVNQGGRICGLSPCLRPKNVINYLLTTDITGNKPQPRWGTLHKRGDYGKTNP